MAGAAHVLVAPPAESQQDTGRRMVVRAARIGLWVWPAFAALDAYMCFVAYPGAPFPLFVAYRVAVELSFPAILRASRRGASVEQLFSWLNRSFGAAALAISLMAVSLGGIVSPYMHGISIVALVRAALVPTHWRRAAATYARIALAFPLVMAVGAVLSPARRAEWLTAEALIAFASNYVFVLTSSVLGMISGHVAWSAQEQLYRARRVGRYRLQAPIGKGGMGEVWLAWDLSLHRNVALKILRASAVPSPETVKRFEREAQAAGQLRGHHVVRIFDFGASDDGLYYIAMEYLPGMDLASLVAEAGPLPPARAVHLLVQGCRALEEAHAAGIIHRDLKPHNLFVTRVDDEPDFVKLLDFGVARLRDPAAGAEQLTWTGLVVGTPSYLAPELARGAPADERSDVYALGVTLLFLLTGSASPEAWRAGSLRVPGSEAGDPVVAALDALLRRCLARDPERRIRSARELCAALEAVRAVAPWTRDDADAAWRASRTSLAARRG
jgi:serine/threonine-protein kinase